MIYKIGAPRVIETSVRLPASKSISNRVLVLNALISNGVAGLPCHSLTNLSDSDDTRVLQRALQSSDADFDIGAAGTSMRFLTAYLAQRIGRWTITGTERMKNRPIALLVDALRTLGADIRYLDKDGFPPLLINGKTLKGGQITMNGGVSSQYISALMMIAPHLEEGLELHLEGNLISLPYLRMTTRLMEQFGAVVLWSGQTLKIAPQTYRSVPFTIESDWSAASYWYEIAALARGNAHIKLLGLSENSVQGDAEGQVLFEKLGVSTTHHCSLLDPCHGTLLDLCHCGLDPQSPPLQYDFVNEPDLAQTFVVTCCLLGVPFHFTGLQSLRIKETDRIAALQTELRKLGYEVGTSDSTMHWSGDRCRPVANPVIATYEDHRMAMAFAPAALLHPHIRIADPHVVTKSYPNFWQDLQQAGFTITEEQ